ncbi:MAG: chromosome segregation protein, partial [Hyphomicrobiaceae bacterium]
MERTVLEFTEGITGIVGPNGCGKSNIIDALRWVLGEQSAKHLRGQSMEDVIFAGNQRYAPLGACEVTITLDNEDAPEPDADEAEESSELVRALRGAPELSVTRRLFRSGESQYLINGKACRLRDITELFLGTGVGTKAYSIIEQGRVGQIVAAKPEELRVFIEEAAGTTLYRSRKIAAERKIERTRDNLLRVGDVIRELERQSASLRRQAQGAIRFNELKGRETELDRYLSSERLRRLDEDLRRVSTGFARTRGRAQALGLAVNQAAALRDRERAGARSAETEAAAARNALFDVRSKIDATRREHEYLEGRVSELGASVTESRDETALMDGRFESLTEERSALVGQSDGCGTELAQLRVKLTEVEANLKGHEDQAMAWSGRFQKVKTEIVDALGARADLRNERAAVESRLRADEERLARLQEERGSLDTVAHRLVQDVTDCQGRLDHVLTELNATQGGKSSAARELETVLEQQRNAERDAETARDESAALRSRHESLGELHEAFAGYGDGVRSFMSNGGRERTGAKAVVADVIEIEDGYEQAVAAALDDRLQYVVVPNAQAGVEGAFYLRETGAGRASFIPLQPRSGAEAGPVPPGFSRLSEHLRVSDGYEAVVAPLLDGIVVADDLEQAQGQWLANGYHTTYVTRSGEVIDASGVVTGGSGRPIDAGILERKAEMRQLSDALGHASGRYSEARESLAQVTAVAEVAGSDLASLDARLHELTVERVSAQGDLELRRQNLVRTQERGESVLREVEDVAAAVSSAQERLAALGASIAQCEAGLAELERKRVSLEREEARLESARGELRELAQQTRVSEAELRQKGEALEIQLRTLDNSVAEIAARREAALDRLGRSEAEIQRCNDRLQSPELDRSGLDTEFERLQTLLSGAEEAERLAREAVELADRQRDEFVG